MSKNMGVSGALVLNLILVFCCAKVDSLECYSCYSVNSGPCFNVSTPEYNSLNASTCSVHSKNLEYEMQRVYGPNFEHSTRSVLDVRCVHYQKYYYLSKSTEVFRGCLQRKYAMEFCDKQAANQEYYLYNLTKCEVCSNDMCNNANFAYGNDAIALIIGLITMTLVV